MDIFGGTTLPLLQTALNRDSLQQNVIAQNIANVDTPGYKEKQVVFGDVFQNALKAKKTDSRQLSFSNEGSSRVVQNQSTTIQNNGNSVNIDQQMSDLAKTQIDDQALVAAVNHKLQDLKLVIKGG